MRKATWPLALALLIAASAQAALLGRNLDGDGTTFEAYYDTVLDITWLADANFAKTSGFDPIGTLTWEVANAWVASLDFNGVTGWRLPTLKPVGASFNDNFSNNGTTDRGYGITSPNSELAYMFYVNLGNKGSCTPNNAEPSSCVAQPGAGLANTGPFSNLEPFNYWFGTEYELNTEFAWVLSMFGGGQFTSLKANEFFANEFHVWAVRPGDVAPLVGVPAAASWLFLSGLCVLVLLSPRLRAA